MVLLVRLHECNARAGRAPHVGGRRVVRQDLDVVVCVAIGLDLQGRDMGRGETILFQMRA
jgi:hypothetical protein